MMATMAAAPDLRTWFKGPAGAAFAWFDQVTGWFQASAASGGLPPEPGCGIRVIPRAACGQAFPGQHAEGKRRPAIGLASKHGNTLSAVPQITNTGSQGLLAASAGKDTLPFSSGPWGNIDLIGSSFQAAYHAGFAVQQQNHVGSPLRTWTEPGPTSRKDKR